SCCRCHHRRVRLRVAGPRPAHRRGRVPAGLSDDPGRGLFRWRGVPLREPPCRPVLCAAGSAGTAGGAMSTTVELYVSSRLGRRAGASPAQIRALIRDTPALVGAALLALFLLAALTAPWIAPGDPNRIDLTRRFTPPSMAHLLGTDNLGRDMLTRLLYG